MIFVYDSETTSLVKQSLPLWHNEQPHLVQVGVVLLAENGTEVDSFEAIVRPEGWAVPANAAAIHGITTERALDEGLPLELVVEMFAWHLERAQDVRVAFNLPFDSAIMTIARLRAKRAPFDGPARSVCAMNAATPILNLPPTDKMLTYGFRGPKRPNLKEAHLALIGEDFDGAHSALADARAAGRVFMKLRDLGHV